ncbi:MAG: hypothetical protein CMD08_02020 [Flavobacteriales bacterium]|nr:hypothetical protein [Flavobacteriales bacterium]
MDTLSMNSDLIDITSPRQLQNGTLMFKCNRTGAIYGSYASGYVRRKVGPNSHFYQLNKTFKPFPDVSNMIKRERLITESARLELINNRSKTFRVKKNTDMNFHQHATICSQPLDTNPVINKSRSYTGSRKNLKWPSYIVQVVHSSMMLNETPDMIAGRLDQMLSDIPNHRFKFNSQQEKIEAIHNVMQHLQSRARQSVDRMIDHIDNVDRSRG